MPVQPVGDAPELLVDEEPLEHRPALAAVLDGVASAVQPPRERLLADHRDVRRRAAGRRGARPPARAASAPPRRTRARGRAARVARRSAGRRRRARWRSSSVPLSGQPRRARRPCARAALPGSPSSRLWWLAITATRELAGADDVRVGRLRPILGERQRAAQVGEPRAQPRAHGRRARRARARARRRPAGGRPPASSVATAAGSRRSGSGVTESQSLRARRRSPGHPCRLTSTDYKVRIEPMAIAPASADTSAAPVPQPPRSPPATTSIRSCSRSSTSASSSAPGSSPGTSRSCRAPAPT